MENDGSSVDSIYCRRSRPRGKILQYFAVKCCKGQFSKYLDVRKHEIYGVAHSDQFVSGSRLNTAKDLREL